MRRDMDIVRSIVLAVSDASGPVNSVVDVSDEDFASHAQLLEEAGLIEAALLPQGKRVATSAVIFRLTWNGHEFADSVRDPKVWAKTKQVAAAGGGFTIDLLKDLAKGLIKKHFDQSKPASCRARSN